ncbi:GTP cyclohydrolase I FolE [Microbacterium sp.]|uniref:GTP cyclohydrolase I FolE n=1 Tax=Microbacterium sp. TaxID=51671 RepID=UPI003F966A66
MSESVLTHDLAPVHVGSEKAKPDLARAELAAGDFLRALGVSLDSPHLAATPQRMARAWAELLAPREFDLTTFPNDEGYDEMVIVRDIPVRSICEHHLLPFRGRASIGYLPGERIVGLSKLARIMEHFACRPQTQERLTKQVAQWLQDHLNPHGVGVIIEAEHSCMTLRGARATGSSTLTSTLLGQLREDPRSRQEFLTLADLSRA